MGNFFNNGSMTMKLHILKVLYGLESHAKDKTCGLSRNGDIRRCVGKLVEKQTLVSVTFKDNTKNIGNSFWFDFYIVDTFMCPALIFKSFITFSVISLRCISHVK